MQDEIVFSRATDADIDDVYQFHYSYTQDMRTKYAWQWEYGNLNPFNSILILASQGVMCMKLIQDNIEIDSGKNESLLIDSSLRKMGLSVKLYQYALEQYVSDGVKCIWGYSRKALPTLRKAGFYTYYRPMSMAFLSLGFKLDARPTEKTLTNKLKRMLVNLGLSLVSVYSSSVFSMRNRSVNGTDYRIESKLLNDEDMTVFYQKMIKDAPHTIYLKQDMEYLNWRLGLSPVPATSIFIYQEDVLCGYIYMIFEEGRIDVIDCLFINRRVGDLLMRELQNKVRETISCKAVTYSGNKHNLLNKMVFRQLIRHGFIVTKGTNDFVLKLLDDSKHEGLLEISNWYMTGIWYEGN